MSEEYLKNYPGETSKLFIAGYVLRIIPVVNIIGAILTGIGYYILWRKWIRDYKIMFGVIAGILLLSGYIINTYYGFITGVEMPNVQQGTPTSQIIQAIDTVIKEMKEWYSLITPVLIGIGLFIEAIALNGIRSRIGSAMPLYVIILLIIFAISEIIMPFASLTAISGLEKLKEDLNAGLPVQDVPLRLLQALLPLLVLSFILFVLTLLTYILLAYRFHVLGRLKREISFISRVEETGESEEVII